MSSIEIYWMIAWLVVGFLSYWTIAFTVMEDKDNITVQIILYSIVCTILGLISTIFLVIILIDKYGSKPLLNVGKIRKVIKAICRRK